MEENLFELKDLKTNPDPIYPYPKDTLTDTPLVIDNGSFHCRAGWATQEKPCLVFKNLVAKTRRERGKKDGEIQVGNDIANIEAVRFQLKTQFDRNVVNHAEVQEQVFDHLFVHLGIDTEGSVNHPIVMTEAFLNPNYSRQMVSELLFECYGVPGVSYGVDALFSYQAEHSGKSGLIVNLGHHSIHIIPMIKGKADPSRARRINLGGFHITGYFHRMLQLKYPVHFNAITLSRAEEIVYEHCALATDYGAELEQWADPDYYDDNVRRIQLPYTAASSAPSLTADQQREKRRELAKRLIEINARKRDERLAEDEEQLNQLLDTQQLAQDGQEKYFQKALASLSSFEISNEADLAKHIGMLRSRIHRTKQKINAINAGDDAPIEETKPKLKPILKPKEGEDFTTWLSGIRKERAEILEQRTARHQRRQDMAKRRTAAAQERMRIISELARKDKRDDNFGMRDEDWDVYKAIRKDGGDSDSEEEQVRLIELEDVLRHHDSSFLPSSSSANAMSVDSPLHPAEAHQLHVGVERFRAPELIFQPSMSGLTDAGLTETIGWVLKGYPPDIQSELVNNIFISGGCAATPGLVDRLTRELCEIRPFQSTFNVSVTQEPLLSTWYAVRDFASSDALPKYLVTKEEYAEKGGELLKEHPASNLYQPSPAPVCQPAVTVEEMEIEIF